jgi:polar amino acid transport system permease protein
MNAVVPWLPTLGGAFELSAIIVVQVLILSTLIGIVGGLLLLYGPLPLRLLARAYVDFTRGIPVLVLIFAVYYVPSGLNISLDAQTAAVVALGVFAGAQVSEIVRGGIGSLPKAQLEAGKAMGLTSLQRFRLIVVPLALPRMMPPWTNTAVEIIKGSALASLIGVTEFLYETQSAVGTTFDPIPFYLFAAAVYFVCGFGLSQASHVVERRYRYMEL